MSRLFLELLERTFDLEGGYSNDQQDSGGETNFGITKKTAESAGFDGPMAGMTRIDAVEIYRKLYWLPINGSGIAESSPAIAEEIFDSGVNLGPGRATRWLQRALNLLNDRGTLYFDINVDGDIGPGTLTALASYLNIRKSQGGELVLLRMLNCRQGASYWDLAEKREKDERFLFGWFSRRVKI